MVANGFRFAQADQAIAFPSGSFRPVLGFLEFQVPAWKFLCATPEGSLFARTVPLRGTVALSDRYFRTQSLHRVTVKAFYHEEVVHLRVVELLSDAV